jgi:hypothetical protein
MALLLGDLPGVEQVELDAAGDPGDAGLAGPARREVSGLFGLAGTAVWQAFAVLVPLCTVVLAWSTAVFRKAVA